MEETLELQKILNFLLLGNNLHGTHHKSPTKPWWEFI